MNSSKKGKKWIILLLILIVLGSAGAYFGYKWAYQEHRVIDSVKADFIGKSEDLMTEVSKSSESWTNRVVEITGEIGEIEDSSCTISEKAFCQMLNGTSGLIQSETITVKGRVIGYDDLWEQVKLDQ